MWIEDYREREGLALDEFTKLVNMHGRKVDPPLEAPVSDTLIHILERSKHGVTHPRIANVIAEVCGATAEQRDMIVADIHRGQWKPKEPQPVVVKATIKKQNGGKAVVKIDKHGNTVGWFESIADAARREPHDEGVIRSRCKRRVTCEFTNIVPFTYRYADEWDALSGAQKIQDIGGGVV